MDFSWSGYILCQKPYLYQQGIDMVFSCFSSSNFFSKSKGALYQLSRSLMITRVHGAPDQYSRCDTSDTKAAVKAKFTTTKNHIYTFKVYIWFLAALAALYPPCWDIHSFIHSVDIRPHNICTMPLNFYNCCTVVFATQAQWLARFWAQCRTRFWAQCHTRFWAQ